MTALALKRASNRFVRMARLNHSRKLPMIRTLYAPLIKTETTDEGFVTFSGIASSEAVDSSGETITAAAMEEALPEFMSFGTGNLREMHQLSAAGTVDSATVDAKTGQTIVTGTVVDAAACIKLRAGVYKGLSIGGKVLERDKKNKNIITKLKLVEISLVDRPSCPEAVLEMWKADGMTPPPGSAHPAARQEQIREALDALSSDERAIVITKAALALPRSIPDILGRGGAGR
jgi:hypothetical protein